jgi:hypothetical protein
VYAFGLLSLIPPLGLFLAPLALWRFFAVWSIAGKEWNPAGGYLHLGLAYSFAGGFISLALLLGAIGAIINFDDWF